MLNALIDYYYYFMHERHYFECHEVMEEAWKSKRHHSKSDIEVGLVLLATSQYHQRRNNHRGAATCLRKAVGILTQHQAAFRSIGLKPSIMDLLTQIDPDRDYKPLTLPLTDDMLLAIHSKYPDFEVRYNANNDWLHYHMTRDRQPVIQTRLQSMHNKRPVDDAPDKGNDNERS
ncbi:DUF309 domain-containing protein [Macrococcus hajekii]|uniref:DUF309 domain-containing protein n=1 Tax=Macrococcus hajekii TaxID=198482 RepID=A0A4R6BMR3_9STAP|nr:DUF309 domain-containing protein [Macrococcus hajekii]TDM02957.1 DUF309 domain-containing protein [Macrococcus hajekii]GGB05268.1 hypothetical protein GCM10007190_11710 [Macrococcus hajekii]